MGRVFRWKDIRKDKIPHPENFNDACGFIDQKLKDSDAISAAMFFGSTAYDNHSMRSDIDVLVIYPTDKSTEAINLLWHLKSYGDERHVPIEFISIDTELAEIGAHSVSTTFLEHLKMIAESGSGFIKENPILRIHPNRKNATDDTEDYLIHKIRRLEKARIELESTPRKKSDYDIIGKALQFPIYAARKMLQQRRVEFPNGDSKSEILRLYPSLHISGAADILFEIQELNDLYDAGLSYQIEHPNHLQYLSLVSKVSSSIGLSQEFARLNLLALR